MKAYLPTGGHICLQEGISAYMRAYLLTGDAGAANGMPLEGFSFGRLASTEVLEDGDVGE